MISLDHSYSGMDCFDLEDLFSDELSCPCVDYDVIGKRSAQDLSDEQLEVRELLRSQQATE